MEFKEEADLRDGEEEEEADSAATIESASALGAGCLRRRSDIVPEVTIDEFVYPDP